jgi:hypothetical protein
VAETQEIHLGHGEGAFLEVDDKDGRLQPPENLLHVLLMLLQRGAGYDDIVKIDEGESQPGQHPIHEPLEAAGGVAQPEGEAQELEEPDCVMMTVFMMSAGCIGIW